MRIADSLLASLTEGKLPGSGGPNALNLLVVSNPDTAFANMTRQEYLDYVENYRDFEEELIDQATTDTSLREQAREDTGIAQQLTKDIAARNLSRYGTTLTPAQQREQSRGLQRANTLGGIQALSDARIVQKE